MICARANNIHDEPELVTWPLTLEGWRNLSGRDVGFSFGTFEEVHVLPCSKLAPDITAFHWVPPAHKGIPLNQVWTLTQNLSLCFENIYGTGKTLASLPLNACNYTILYDSDDHEFTPCWNQED